MSDSSNSSNSIVEKLALLYLEKNFDKFNSPEELKDLYWEIKKRIAKHKTPNFPTTDSFFK